ncbi:hypothetical protein ASG11_11005 [Sphingomonas sp. Leaf357]|uniref:alpha-L-rhamnosidase n=1 Tax=Sphingomonas sp. Leaf357 TaxID=1736350 RepID=UPI0007011E15|nr:alpha-L-rhamnosidase [Sphingomonas sp. Leaf357]KQS04712.1 hypothetical protein ASG11_11005 [Sphingomonas sp. Leaf357]
MTHLTRRETLALLTASIGTPSLAAQAEAIGTLLPRDLRIDHRIAPAGLATARPRFGWTLAARDPAQRNLRQSAARVIVTDPGGTTLFDSGRIDGPSLALVPPQDLALPAQTPLDWRVMVWDQDARASPWSRPARFVTGVEGAWRGFWIAAERDGPITAPPSEGAPPATSTYTLPLLRRAFRIQRAVRHAVLCVAGLGAHTLSINGREPSRALLNPGWTDFRKTVLYETIDITDHLRVGANMLGIRLGGGMYDVAKRPGRYTKFVGSFGAPKLILQLRIVHDDGSERWIVSDGDWRTRPGPILFSSIFGGEDHDARREPIGWDLPDAGDAGWAPVVATTGPGGALRPQTTPGLTVAEKLKTVAVTHPAPGIAVHDLGRNIAGRPRLTVRGKPGTTIRITPGELLDAAGRVTQASMGASAREAIRFDYTLGGCGDDEDEQVWTPRFAYTGFRYLEVEGEGVVALDGEFIRADLASSGGFACSDPHIEAIYGLIRQAVLSNVATVLTDCPHREKLGWLEQTWLNAGTVFHTIEALPLYDKTLGDIIDAQRDDGMVPSIAPEYIRFVYPNGQDTPFRHSPEWGSAVVQSPWAAYRFGGDPAILARAWPAMRRYMDYLATRSVDATLDVGLGDWYDIGPNPPGAAQLTSRAFTGTAIWYADLRAMQAIATILDKPAEAAACAGQADRLKAIINARFLDPGTGGYDRNSQTANAMALVLDLPPAERRDAVLNHLIADIRARGDHVSAGDIGFHYVVRALAAAAPERLAVMLARRDAPSYGAQLAKGATALTEAWDANPSSSQNHFMLGHAMSWLFTGLCGIDCDFARGVEDALWIAPTPVPGITAAAAWLVTPFGTVRTRWRTVRGRFHLDVAIPAGASARIRMPATTANTIRESGRPLSARPEIGVSKGPLGAIDLRVGSGTYRFTASLST